MNDMDERISAALHAAVDGLTEQDLRPADPPTAHRRRRQTIRWAAPLLTAAAVAAAIVTTVALASSPNASHEQPPGGPGPVTTPTGPAPDSLLPVSTTVAPPSAVRSPESPPTTLGGGGAPLWPFASAAEAAQWETVDGPSGQSPWHASAKDTALFFTRGYLQFLDITEVTSADIQPASADIGVGYDVPSGDKHTASVVHLVRYGNADGAPWEVVSATADGLSITTPAYGDTVSAPLTVRGLITGVDESVSAHVRSLDGEADDSSQVPAGGENAEWTATVAYSQQERGVLSIVASTGGHLTAHERFTVVGVTTA